MPNNTSSRQDDEIRNAETYSADVSRILGDIPSNIESHIGHLVDIINELDESLNKAIDRLGENNIDTSGIL